MRKKKNKSIGKTVGFVITIIFTLLFLRVGVYLVAQYRTSIWDGKTNLAIALRADGDYFVLLNNFQKKLYIIKIPHNTVVDYQNSQDYTLDAIWQLGKIDKNQKALYMEEMQSLFGYPVRAIYTNTKINLNNFDIRMSDIFLTKTNLSIFDYLRIKSKTYKVIKRSLSDYVRPKTYKIKDEVRFVYNEAQIDHELSDIFEDVSLSNLGYRVQIKVLNLEQNQKDKISRIVNNIGWKMADVEYVDDVKNENQCILKSTNKIEELIRNSFSCQLIFQDKIIYDLIIVVGKKFRN